MNYRCWVLAGLVYVFSPAITNAAKQDIAVPFQFGLGKSLFTAFVIAGENTIPVTGIGVDHAFVFDGDVLSRILLVPYREELFLNTAGTLFFYEVLTWFQA